MEKNGKLKENKLKFSEENEMDIPVVYTGLCVGEKLYEEKLMSEEGLRRTPNNLIHIGNPIYLDVDKFLEQLQKLMELAYGGHDDAVRALVSEIVPTYHPAENSLDGAYKSSSHVEKKVHTPV